MAYEYVVYFIQPVGGGPVKIGSTIEISIRAETVSLWSPVPLKVIGTTPGTRILERLLHSRFRQHRSHGEWFHPAPEVLEVAEAAAKGIAPIEARFDEPIPYWGGNVEIVWKVRQFCEARGVTAEDMAEAFGCKPTTARQTAWRNHVDALAVARLRYLFWQRGEHVAITDLIEQRPIIKRKRAAPLSPGIPA